MDNANIKMNHVLFKILLYHLRQLFSSYSVKCCQAPFPIPEYCLKDLRMVVVVVPSEIRTVHLPNYVTCFTVELTCEMLMDK
jgi:hypothetical protein